MPSCQQLKSAGPWRAAFDSSTDQDSNRWKELATLKVLVNFPTKPIYNQIFQVTYGIPESPMLFQWQELQY